LNDPRPNGVCVKKCTSGSAKWRRVYVSRADAFGKAIKKRKR